MRAELAEIAAARPADRNGRLAEGGWVVPHLPRPWGRDAGPLEQLVIAEEMRAAGLRAPGLAIGAWVVPALVQYGTPEQQERFLPPTLRGELIWCQLFSEPGAGSDLAGLSTRAERAEGGWRLTGQKIWTSLAKQAAWAICVARTDPDAPRHDGISYFLVDMTSPGVQVRPLREMTGDALFNEVFLDEVFVPDDLVVGGVNQGWRVARTTLANERVSLSQSWTFGCGNPELIEAVHGLGAGAGQAVLERAGRLVAEGHAIDLLGMRVTLKQLSGTEPGATGSVRKLLGMRHAQRVAEECWSLTGPEVRLVAPGGRGRCCSPARSRSAAAPPTSSSTSSASASSACRAIRRRAASGRPGARPASGSVSTMVAVHLRSIACSANRFCSGVPRRHRRCANMGPLEYIQIAGLAPRISSATDQPSERGARLPPSSGGSSSRNHSASTNAW